MKSPPARAAAIQAAADLAMRRAEREHAWATYEWANAPANAQYAAMPIAHHHAATERT